MALARVIEVLAASARISLVPLALAGGRRRKGRVSFAICIDMILVTGL
jgi:hypothetical protein